MPGIDIIFIGKDQVSKVMKGIGGNFAKMGSTIGSVAKGAALGGVAALGAGVAALGVGIAASVKEGTTFTKQMSAVGAVSGATQEQMLALENTAKELGATTSFSGIQAAEGMQFLAQAGFEVNDIISAMPGVLNLAAASGSDLGASADIVSNIISGFGASADETGKFVDILTNTFTTSNVNLQQLGESMKFAAPVAKGLGQSVEVTAASLGILGNAGLQGATAGEKFRSILSRLANPTKVAGEELDKLGVSVFNSTGEMRPFPDLLKEIGTATAGMTQEQKNATLATLFSMENAGAFQILLAEGNEVTADGTTRLAEYSKELLTSGTAATVAKGMLNNLSGDVTLFQSALSGVKLDVFEALEPILRSVVGTATTLLGGIPPLLAKIDFAAIGVNASAAFGVLITFAQNTVPIAIKFLADTWTNTLLPALTTAWAFIQNNIIPVVIAIGNLLGSFLSAQVQILSAIWTSVLLPAFKIVGTFITDTILPLFAELGGAAGGDLSTSISGLADMFTNTLLPGILSFVEFAAGILLPALQGIFNFLGVVLPPVIRFFAAVWTNVLLPAITNFWDFLQNSLIPTFTSIADVLTLALGPAIKSLGDIWTTTLLPAIKTVNTFFREKIGPTLIQLWQFLELTLPPAIEAVATTWNDTFLPALDAVWLFLKDTLIPIIETIIDVFIASFSPALSDISDIINDVVVPAFTSISDFLKDTLKPAINDFVTFLNGAPTTAFNAFSAVVEGISDAFQFVIDKADKLIGWLDEIKEAVKIDIPDWMKLGSPPPLAVAFSMISDEVMASTKNLSALSAAMDRLPGLSSIEGGTTSSETTNNFNLTVNSSSETEPLVSDFNTLRSGFATI